MMSICSALSVRGTTLPVLSTIIRREINWNGSLNIVASVVIKYSFRGAPNRGHPSVIGAASVLPVRHLGMLHSRHVFVAFASFAAFVSLCCDCNTGTPSVIGVNHCCNSNIAASSEFASGFTISLVWSSVTI